MMTQYAYYLLKEDETGFKRKILTEKQAHVLLCKNPNVPLVIMDSERGYAALYTGKIKVKRVNNAKRTNATADKG